MAERKKRKEEEFLDGDGEEFAGIVVSAQAKRSIVAIMLFLIAAICALGFADAAGVLGQSISVGIGMLFGWGKYIAPLVLVLAGLILLRDKVRVRFYVTKLVGLSLAFWCVLGLFHVLFVDAENFRFAASAQQGGGYVGFVAAQPLVQFTGVIVAVLILVALIVVGLIVAFDLSFVGLGDKVPTDIPVSVAGIFGRRRRENDDGADASAAEDGDTEEDVGVVEEDDAEEDEVSDEEDDRTEFDDDDVIAAEDEIAQPVKSAGERAAAILETKATDAKRMRRNDDAHVEWELPPLRLLKAGTDKAQGGDVQHRAERIQETFANFGITMELEDVVTGPTVTQYSFRPQSGVKLSRITALNADLALALAAHPIRIEAPIPGKSLVGIEVPNKTRATVRMRDLLNTDAFDDPDKKLLLALGEDVNGDHVFEDLAKMPHLLVAGTTGSGKSVTINCILLSLLYKNSPEDLKLILVDPKRVELTLYAGIPHLLSDVIVDNGKVINALKWAVSEMERRYKLLQETGSRDLASYRQKRAAGETYVTTDPDTGESVHAPMENLPVIVIVIDELSDLMSSHGKEVEGVIVRLAQMSRAIGIHLIISTQRPSVEVITGLIKANLPTRIALRVATNIDSRTIIDVPGAEKLVGNGDLLFVGPQSTSPKRLQSAYVDEDELKRVVRFIRRQAEAVGAYDIGEDFSANRAADATARMDFADTESYEGSDDPMYEDAKQAVIEAGRASTSYIQRRLRVGYSRAARLMDDLEKNGVIGPADGSKPRQVIGATAAEDDADDNATT